MKILIILIIILITFTFELSFCNDWKKFSIDEKNKYQYINKKDNVLITRDEYAKGNFKEDFLLLNLNGTQFFFETNSGEGSYKIIKNILLIKKSVGRGTSVVIDIIEVINLKLKNRICSIDLCFWDHDGGPNKIPWRTDYIYEEKSTSQYVKITLKLKKKIIATYQFFI